MSVKKLSPIVLTKSQREWLEKESENTCNSFATIVRGLIQEKVNGQQKAGA